MALQGRADLEQLTGTNLPTNNSKQITAEKHRQVVEALIESKFNLKEDTLKQLKYDALQTLEEYLGGLLRGVIKRPSFSGYNVHATSGVGDLMDIDDSENSILEEVRVTAVGDVGNRFRITFKESIERKAITPVLYGANTGTNASSNYHNDYDIGPVVLYYINSTTIDLAIRELKGDPQNLKIELVII